MAATWSNKTWIGWSLMTFMAVGVGAYAIAFIFAGGIERVLPGMAYHVPDRYFWAATHFGVGALVLCIGPFQFVPTIRSKRPALHRWVGRVYVVGCIASGLAGLVLATYISTGNIAQLGFSLLAVSWLVTTGTAYLKARARDFRSHRQWMIRSYALTLAAVTLRIYLGIGAIGFDIGYPVMSPFLSFACWVPNAIVAEWFVRR